MAKRLGRRERAKRAAIVAANLQAPKGRDYTALPSSSSVEQLGSKWGLFRNPVKRTRFVIDK